MFQCNFFKSLYNQKEQIKVSSNKMVLYTCLLPFFHCSGLICRVLRAETRTLHQSMKLTCSFFLGVGVSLACAPGRGGSQMRATCVQKGEGVKKGPKVRAHLWYAPLTPKANLQSISFSHLFKVENPFIYLTNILSETKKALPKNPCLLVLLHN